MNIYWRFRVASHGFPAGTCVVLHKVHPDGWWVRERDGLGQFIFIRDVCVLEVDVPRHSHEEEKGP